MELSAASLAQLVERALRKRKGALSSVACMSNLTISHPLSRAFDPRKGHVPFFRFLKFLSNPPLNGEPIFGSVRLNFEEFFRGTALISHEDRVEGDP
jgi:hypothetical protein